MICKLYLFLVLTHNLVASSQLDRWLAEAPHQPLAIPSEQSDPRFHYVALEFHKSLPTDLISKRSHQYQALTGWQHVGQLGQLPQYQVFRSRNRTGTDHGLDGIQNIVHLNQHKRLRKRQQIPGFGDRSSNQTQEWHTIVDPAYPKQWHLANHEDPGNDVNVTGVWKQGITGQGVTVALIDDGLDYTSEDLLENFDFMGSYDFNDKTKLPTPRLTDDYHGTRCAGQIAALRNNMCGVGVAYGAKVAGIRMLSKEVTDQDEITSLNYRMDTNWIYSCSWGPNDDGKTVQGPDKHVEAAFINGIEKGRQGRGSIYVFATGNGGHLGDNCNFDGYTNSIYTISIGALDHKNRHPYYSEQCSAHLAVTYSNGDGHGITTTDLGLRKCTDKHGGTSAAAPLGAGIIALALSVRPSLTWRDVQHLTVRAAVPVDLTDSDWEMVAEGRKYNHKYGFGKMDAGRIVELAKHMEHVGKQTKVEVGKDQADARIEPLKQQNGESEWTVRKVAVTKDQIEKAKMLRTEHVTVIVDLEHEYRGNIEVWLRSPKGVRSQLAAVRRFDSSKEGLRDWRFMSVKHWGEDPVGEWSLHVRNAYQPDYKGKLKAWQLTVYGESSEREVPREDKPVEVAPPPVEEKPKSGMSWLWLGVAFMVGTVVSGVAAVLYMRRRHAQKTTDGWTALETIEQPQTFELNDEDTDAADTDDEETALGQSPSRRKSTSS